MKPICTSCRRFFRLKRSGYYFIEAMPTPGESRALPGNAEPHRWTPYKVWAGDLWVCPGCNNRIVHGTGQRPVAEHYEEHFAATLANLGADQLTVNDC